jgi:uncharacterized membrane protein HdeD (DUF308 family)
MATSDTTARDVEADATPIGAVSLQRRWGWLLVLGIVQVVCGALALTIPVAASLAAAIVAGVLLLVSGVFQLLHAFSIRRSRGMLLPALGGVLYVIAGALLLIFPVMGALTLTIVVAALLIADGVVRSILARRLTPMPGRGWLLAGGIASVAVGILLLIGWPLTGLWALGILLGVNLIFSGATHSALAMAFRSRDKRARKHEPLEHTRRHA